MLKWDIYTSNVLIVAAGGMIGSGWLFTSFIGAKMASPDALISWIIAAIFMLFIALPLCELWAMLQLSGGMSNYPTFTHGRTVGFFVFLGNMVILCSDDADRNSGYFAVQ